MMNKTASGDALHRPTFYEGQIVAAADLNQVVDNARTALARHERYLHLWGIADGLNLSAEARQTSAGDSYQEVSLQPGLAVDGRGRHLVLSAAERLSEDKFDQLNLAINDPQAYYPVFLTGRDEAASVAASPLLACQDGGSSRVQEVIDITFGRVEDAADPNNQPVGGVADGPGDGLTGGSPWRVLVGFVQWDASIKRFSAVTAEHDGIGPQYAGVRADEVVAQGGRLSLRSTEKGENGTPVMEIDQAGDGELRFGPQNSSGAVVPVFTINSKGDVHAEGKITGALAGGAQFQSGAAYDGMLLPLPAGIDPQRVSDGEVTIQATVTPRYGTPALPALPAGERWLMRPIECRVVERRVYCRVRWESTDGSGGSPIELPGVCDYSLMAFAPDP